MQHRCRPAWFMFSEKGTRGHFIRILYRDHPISVASLFSTLSLFSEQQYQEDFFLNQRPCTETSLGIKFELLFYFLFRVIHSIKYKLVLVR